MLFRTLLSSALLAIFPAGPVSAAPKVPQKAEALLQRMAASLTRENYAGVISYLRGSQLESIELVHSYREGVESERITWLTGAEREIIRRGQDTTVYVERGVTPNTGLSLGSVSRSFSENIQVYMPYYDLSLTGRDRVAGRPTLELSIRPRRADRYGYRLSVDESTGLLLRSAMYDPGRDQTLEVMQFARIDFPAAIRAAQLLPTLGIGEATEAEAGSSRRHKAKPNWQVGWLPQGFTHSGRQHDSARGAMFTDGLASLSIFVESADTAMQEFETRMGGTVVLTRRLARSDQQVTLVGEVPVTVARQIAASVSQ